MRSRIGRNVALLAIVSLLLFLFQTGVPSTQAAIHRVPQDYPTIQDAVNLASPGDTIEVSADIYYENVLVETPLTIKGQDKYSTIVDGEGRGHGFWLMSDNVTISGFTVRNGNYCAIKAEMTGNHLITDNVLSNSPYGVYLFQTPSASDVVGNIFHSNDIFGIKTSGSSNNNISNNHISDSTYGIKLDDTSDYNSIVNNTISETSHGIYVGYCSNNNIDENNVSSRINGIYCLYSDYINIRNNTLLKCAFGIQLYGTSNSMVLDNTMAQKNGYGMYLVLASGNTIDSNLMSNNDWGIGTYDSDNNNIIQNTLSYNTYGIHLTTYSTENTIALNSIIENTMQRHQDGSSGGNIWYKQITGKNYGNYWTDYTGEDTNGDGVGDTNLETPHHAVDPYPLMEPWIIANDVAILSVTLSSDTVYQGQVANITVVVRNEGTANETFNVTAKYFNLIIETETVTNLTQCESTTLVFSWDTTDVPTGFNYKIRAEATPVANETDIADNTFVDGTITVEKPPLLGDVNGDGVVDASDLCDLSMAYGSEFGVPNWNPECDFNGDNKVDDSDLFELVENYGETA